MVRELATLGSFLDEAVALSTTEIAADLYRSPHIVRDHVKALFEKVGVSSRGEVVHRVFAEHYATPSP